jgi:hypothetical protein
MSEFGDLPIAPSILPHRVEALGSIGGHVIGEGSYGKRTLERDPKEPPLVARRSLRPLSDPGFHESLQRPDFVEVDGFRIPASIQGFCVHTLERSGSEEIGSGEFSTVALEDDPQHPAETKIAVTRSLRWSDRVDFVREIDNLIKLRHPCIIEIRGWSLNEKSKTVGIHMQYAQRGALGNYLADRESGRPRSFGDATRKAQLICDIVMGMVTLD